MKQHIYIALLFSILLSCDGKFEAGNNSFFTLKSPSGDRCEVGNLVPDNSLKMNVEFAWEYKGTFTEATLMIFDEEGDLFLDKTYQGEIPSKDEFIIDRNKNYSWTIEGTDASGNRKETKPELFFSELLVERAAPYPPLLELISDGNGFTLIITSSELEFNNEVIYQPYFSVTPVEIGAPLNVNVVNFEKSGGEFNYGSSSMITEELKNGLLMGDYFFRVDAIFENNGNPLISSSYIRASMPANGN